MSEASANTSKWATAIRCRRQALLQRVAMGGATALIFVPFFGWTICGPWLVAYFAVQLADLMVFAPINTGRTERMGPVRSLVGTVVLFLNGLTFSSLSIALWMTSGVMGGLVAAVMTAAAAIYGVVNSPRSRTVLIATIAPHLLYLAMTPAWMLSYGATSPFILIVTAALCIFGSSCIATWRLMDRAADAEIAARMEADRKRAEAERIMTDRNAFLAAVGHDLRTPISAILTGAGELERSAADSCARTQAALIADAGVMMKALLDDLLDHSKLDAGRMTVESVDLNLRSLIAQTLRFWQGEARARGLTLRVEGVSSIPAAVRGDPMRLRQVLNNLISNAMKFTPEGSITLRLSVWEEEPSDYAVLIEVTDTGPGMTTGQLARLFTPFDQTADGVSARHGGTGLGLTISRDLVHLMGGRLTARSRPGEGAAFTVSLILPRGHADALPSQTIADSGRGDIVRRLSPRLDPVPVAVAAVPTPPPEPETAITTPARMTESVPDPVADDQDRPLRVLVVDDHDINRRAVELILTPLGCDISMAEDGLIALSACEAKVFDVIFMDVRMPELDGRETTRRLRAGGGANAGTPVIAVTADTSPDDVAACMAAGMDYFVSKPLTPAALLGALNQVLTEVEAETDPSSTAAA